MFDLDLGGAAVTPRNGWLLAPEHLWCSQNLAFHGRISSHRQGHSGSHWISGDGWQGSYGKVEELPKYIGMQPERLNIISHSRRHSHRPGFLAFYDGM